MDRSFANGNGPSAYNGCDPQQADDPRTATFWDLIGQDMPYR